MTKPQRKPPKPRHYADLPKSRSLNRADEVPSGIKPDPEHPTQSIAAQIAATKAKTPSPADIERKLSTIPPPAPLPTTDAERDAVLVRMAPPVDIAAPTAPQLHSRPCRAPRHTLKTFLLRAEFVGVWGISAAFCIAFWFIVVREVYGLVPILWQLTGETFERALAILQHSIAR